MQHWVNDYMKYVHSDPAKDDKLYGFWLTEEDSEKLKKFSADTTLHKALFLEGKEIDELIKEEINRDRKRQRDAEVSLADPF